MKKRQPLIVFCSLIFLMVSSCEKVNDLPFNEILEGNGTLLRILLYADIDSEAPMGIVEEYEYDDDDRVSRVSSPRVQDGEVVSDIWYDLYEYNSKGLLISIKNFNANTNAPTGFLNLKNISYTYSSDGKKKKEVIEYPQMNSSEYSQYIYDQNRLVRIDHFGSSDQLESYVEKEYDDKGYLVKESTYTSDNQILSFTLHQYTSGLNTQSDVYAGSKNDHIREILKTYDEDFNLIVLVSNELSPVSSRMSYVLKYEYMEE